LSNKLSEQEDKGSEIDKTKKKIELDMENLKKQIADCEGTLEKSRGDTAARDEQIKNLQAIINLLIPPHLNVEFKLISG